MVTTEAKDNCRAAFMSDKINQSQMSTMSATNVMLNLVRDLCSIS